MGGELAVYWPDKALYALDYLKALGYGSARHFHRTVRVSQSSAAPHFTRKAHNKSFINFRYRLIRHTSTYLRGTSPSRPTVPFALTRPIQASIYLEQE